jgi:acylphosphatase
MIKHVNITVTGQVQGVGFRNYIDQKAREFDVKGYVENQEDGTVYIEAEACEEDIKKFIEECKKGSPYSKVKDLKFNYGSNRNYQYFSVR